MYLMVGVAIGFVSMTAFPTVSNTQDDKRRQSFYIVRINLQTITTSNLKTHSPEGGPPCQELQSIRLINGHLFERSMQIQMDKEEKKQPAAFVHLLLLFKYPETFKTVNPKLSACQNIHLVRGENQITKLQSSFQLMLISTTISQRAAIEIHTNQ